MVGLAKELEGEPFHLIASVCQIIPKEKAMTDLKKHGWSKEIKNMAVRYQTRHPEFKAKHVPYYMIFDQKGKLRHRHIAGPYHGGDGDRYMDLVKKLLKEIPKKDDGGLLKREEAFTEMRIWRNAEGKEMKASLLKVVNGIAHFRSMKGRTFQYPLSKLSEGDQVKIQEHLKKNDE